MSISAHNLQMPCQHKRIAIRTFHALPFFTGNESAAKTAFAAELTPEAYGIASADREALLTLKSAIAFGDEHSLSYTDAQSDQKSNVIEDLDGNDLATG